jgi:hypothetical protein
MKYFMLLTLLLVSCSNLREECKKTNWYHKGKEDALKGERLPRNRDYQRACLDVGIEISHERYQKGFDLGLKRYCTYKRGLQMGSTNQDDHLLCEQKYPKFKKGFHKGFRAYRKKLRKTQKLDKASLKRELLSDYDDRQCTFNSDCDTADGKGECIKVSDKTALDEVVSVKVCSDYIEDDEPGLFDD